MGNRPCFLYLVKINANFFLIPNSLSYKAISLEIVYASPCFIARLVSKPKCE